MAVVSTGQPWTGVGRHLCVLRRNKNQMKGNTRMKTSLMNQIRNLGASVTLALLVGLWPSLAGASTFVYDLTRISPDVLPENVPSSPWTLHGGGSHTVSDPSNVLTLTDPGTGSGPYFTHDLTGQISSTS